MVQKWMFEVSYQLAGKFSVRGMSALDTEKATAVNHEWQTQALAAASGSNAQSEGADFAAVAVTPTVRLGNIAQISSKYAQVTGTQQAVKHAGRANEMAYQEMLKGLELKRDMNTSSQPRDLLTDKSKAALAKIEEWANGDTKAESKPSAGAPKVGDVQQGYRFKGGNPADRNSWERVN